LDGVLANKKYLVGEKVTIADFSFVAWDIALPYLLDGFELTLQELGAKYPHFARWEEGLRELPAVKKTLELRNKAIA
jgi:glutathione S-transferase